MYVFVGGGCYFLLLKGRGYINDTRTMEIAYASRIFLVPVFILYMQYKLLLLAFVYAFEQSGPITMYLFCSWKT